MPGTPISGREAPDILRAYHPQIEAWAREVIGRRVRGTLRERALADIAPELQSEVAEAFITAARRGKVLATNLRGFLYLITARAAMRLVGRRWRLDRIEVVSSTTDPANDNHDGDDPESLLLARERIVERSVAAERARHALAALSPRDRRLVEARTGEEPVPFEGLALELRITAEAARIAFFRAIRKLRTLLTERSAA